jgi:hypothetical protein
MGIGEGILEDWGGVGEDIEEYGKLQGVRLIDGRPIRHTPGRTPDRRETDQAYTWAYA